MVFELFPPGPLCLLSGRGGSFPILSATSSTCIYRTFGFSFSGSGVSNRRTHRLLIASPEGRRGGPGQSYQYQPEGWDFESETRSQAGSSHSRTHTPPARSAFLWALAFDRSSNPAFRQPLANHKRLARISRETIGWVFCNLCNSGLKNWRRCRC